MKKLLVIRITINLITGGGMNNENCYGQAKKYSNNEVNQITKKITSWNNCGDLWIFLVDKKNKGNKKDLSEKEKIMYSEELDLHLQIMDMAMKKMEYK